VNSTNTNLCFATTAFHRSLSTINISLLEHHPNHKKVVCQSNRYLVYARSFQETIGRLSTGYTPSFLLVLASAVSPKRSCILEWVHPKPPKSLWQLLNPSLRELFTKEASVSVSQSTTVNDHKRCKTIDRSYRLSEAR